MSNERKPCGTTAAYMRHRRNKETACIQCRAAWRTWQQDRRREAMKRGVGK